MNTPAKSHGQEAAAIQGYIATIRGINSRIQEIDSSLWDEGLAISHRRRRPLIDAINRLDEIESDLAVAARELVD